MKSTINSLLGGPSKPEEKVLGAPLSHLRQMHRLGLSAVRSTATKNSRSDVASLASEIGIFQAHSCLLSAQAEACMPCVRCCTASVTWAGHEVATCLLATYRGLTARCLCRPPKQGARQSRRGARWPPWSVRYSRPRPGPKDWRRKPGVQGIDSHPVMLWLPILREGNDAQATLYSSLKPNASPEGTFKDGECLGLTCTELKMDCFAGSMQSARRSSWKLPGSRARRPQRRQHSWSRRSSARWACGIGLHCM